MQFTHPWIAWLVLPITAALAGFFWWAWRVKRRLMTQFVHARLLGQLTSSVSPQRQKARLALLTFSVFLLLIALAGPRWGYDWEEARQRGLDIVVAIDVSRSMLADDINPNRLARAKLAALDLKKLARTDRMALVAFAGTAFMQCPLTYDDEVFRQSINELKANIIPQGGTAVSEAITASLGAFKEKTDNHKILVMFTDGEDHDSGALDTARDAGKDGLRIFTVGVGTPNGEMLRTVDEKGRVEFIKDEEGHAVKSRLNESLLQEIAKATGGFYQRLAGANTIDTLYERGLAPLPKTEFAAQRVRRWHERYQWFLGLAIALLVAEMFIPERRSHKTTKTPAEEKPSSPSAAAARTAALIALALMIGTAAEASPDAALKRYAKGRYDSALSEYERLLEKKPADPALSFNAGTAAFQAGDYGKAAEHLQSALLAPDLKLQQGAWYNMGNTQFRLGEDAKELEDKERLWTQSTNSFDSALKLNPQDADARANLEFVQRKLEELKQQQQQQQKDKSDKQDDKDQKDKDDQQQQQNQKQDQKDQQQKQDQEKNQEKADEQKKQEQEQQKQREQQQQEQKKADEQKAKEQQQAGKKPDQKPESDGKPENKNAQPNQQMEVRMTPQQAKQLLDTQKDDERMMIFLPEGKTNRANRVFKDW